MDLITASFANVFRLEVIELDDKRKCVNGSGTLQSLITTKKNSYS